MVKLLRKIAVLKLSDSEYQTLLDILSSLPYSDVHICQKMYLAQPNPKFLITNEIISALYLLRKKRDVKTEWKPVLDMFLDFAKHNSILT